MCMQDSGLTVLPLSATVPTVGPGHAEALFRPGAVDDSLEAVLNLDSRWGLPGPRSGGDSCAKPWTPKVEKGVRERFASETGVSLSRASLIKHMASGWFQSILAHDSEYEYGFCSVIVHFQPSATHAMFVTLVASAVPFVTVAPKRGQPRRMCNRQVNWQKRRPHFASETFHQKIPFNSQGLRPLTYHVRNLTCSGTCTVPGHGHCRLQIQGEVDQVGGTLTLHI